MSTYTFKVSEAFLEEEYKKEVPRLTIAQSRVYDSVCELSGSTARELGMLFFPEDWRIPGRRLKEIVDMGLVKVGRHRRRNLDTGFLANVYYTIDDSEKFPDILENAMFFSYGF
jgi:hypothetical protein